MRLSLSQQSQLNPLADPRFFGLAVLIPLPALLFSPLMSPWAPLVAIGSLALLFGLRAITTGQGFSHPVVDGALGVLLLLLPLGLWVSTDPAVTLPRAYAFVANVAIFWAMAAQRHNPWLRYSSWLLLGGAILLGAAMLLGTNFGMGKLPFIDQEVYEVLPGGWRPFWNAEGFNSNLTGGVLALFWPLVFVLTWGGYNWQQRDSAKAVLVGLTGLLLLAQSRGALLGVLAALPVITLLHHRRWWGVWAAVAIAVVAGLVYYGPGPAMAAVLGPSEILGANSLRGRLLLWGFALQLILAQPLTGVGLGLFEPAVLSIAHSTFGDLSQSFKHAHNLYLQAGAEMGLLGMAAHLTIFGVLLRLLWQRATDPHAGFYRVLAMGLLGSLVVFLVHGLFEVVTYAPRAAVVIWALFGFMVAVATQPVVAQRGRSRTSESTRPVTPMVGVEHVP